jgi:myo-inositol-1(or 4)-monophosphatase
MPESLRPYLDFAVETAYQAGRLTLGYFRRGLTPDLKTDGTPVTVADKEAEELIRARIEKCFPGHAVLGEEFGADDKETSYLWLVDPIDGTKAFVRGVPLYGVLLGLEIGGRVEVGVAYFPALGEMVFAASGEGCYCNGRRVHVLDTPTLALGFISCTDPGSFDEYGRGAAWRRMQRAAYHRAGWSDAYGHALVATGRLELMCDPVMSPWDCGPFPVILREAGGYFGDWSGRETVYGGEAISTPRALLPEVLKLIRGQ